MADRGIIFAAPMVRALLDGRKTQTRRLFAARWGLGAPVNLRHHGVGDYSGLADDPASWGFPFAEDGCDMSLKHWPQTSGYSPGDRLYVREAIRCFADVSDDAEFTYLADGRRWHTGPCTGDIPDAGLKSYFKLVDRAKKGNRVASSPSIHMPRWASRLTLSVTDVRVQRLQDISEADAIAEGIYEVRSRSGDGMRHFGTEPNDSVWPTATRAYRALWDSLHAEPGTRWEDNPWIVAVSFDVRQGNIDSQAQGQTHAE